MSAAQRVLVYPSGTEIGLEIGRSLEFSKHFEAIGVNSIADHSEMVFHTVVLGAPRADDPALPEHLLRVARETGASLVIPAHDEAMTAMASLRDQGLIVIGPGAELAAVLRYKSATYDALAGEDFLPRRYDAGTLPEAGYPLFGRPDRGQGSVGAAQLPTRQAALDYLCGPAPGVVTQFLPGAEYTVDCYSDAHGRLLSLMARERLRIRSGICVRVAEAPPAEFLPIAERINARLGLRGPWFFQVKRNRRGALKLMEVANRIAGTMGYDRLRGVNLVEMALFEACGAEVSAPVLNPAPQFAYDRALEARVRWCSPRIEQVFVDFDDTLLLCGGRLNHTLVGILFGLKCSLGVPITLITRHAGDLPAALHRLGITGLFASVEHLDARQPKAERIPAQGFCVLVDDSFAERQNVARARPNVLCLGPESAAFLAGALPTRCESSPTQRPAPQP